jgi:MerR family transcriptional regulator, light-induced transcriptional regulator
MSKPKQKAASAGSTSQTPQFRSAAVARMTLIPVATLRVWEQRYQAVSPSTTASGHRLYDLADVQRVLLLRQLTHRGHAISSLAALQTEQLQALVGQHAGIAQAIQLKHRELAGALRLVVVGQALAERLQRPAVAQRAGTTIEVVAEFATLAEAAQAAQATSRNRKGEVDALIWQSSGLQPSAPPELEAVRDAWAVNQVAVVYRFAGAAARRVFSDIGAFLFQDKADDAGLGSALASVASRIARRLEPADLPGLKASAGGSALRLAVSAAPRRFDDAVLTAIAALPSASACECPRHVAELLMQIASFESYSADCANRSQDDAELHAHLHQVAGVARQLFESAIEVVARHEGLSLS